MEQTHDERLIFDRVAVEYECFRPGHAGAVFDDVVLLSRISPGARILEIGCGAAQATVELARRGYQIRAIELGAALANRARARLAAFPRVQVEAGAFEGAAVEPGSADLVFCASAFHWL